MASLLPFFSAYRIHVSRSTVQTLLSLDEGYTIDVRGQTELKVRDCPGDQFQLARLCKLSIGGDFLCSPNFESRKTSS